MSELRGTLILFYGVATHKNNAFFPFKGTRGHCHLIVINDKNNYKNKFKRLNYESDMSNYT